MNVIDLKGRAAVVTGGARGIGYATAQKMLASGASVALWDVDEAALAANQLRREETRVFLIQQGDDPFTARKLPIASMLGCHAL